MSFTFAADPQALLAERAAQFTSAGIRPALLETVRPRLRDLWADQAGGWPFEWSAAARRVEVEGDPLQASLLYGLGRYPCLGNEAHVQAYARQLDSYLQASADFTGRFERRLEVVRHRGSALTLPIHLLHHPGRTTDVPVLLCSGGVDTWKMDIHRFGRGFGALVGAHVAMIDAPGTGEWTGGMAADSDLVLAEIIDRLRSVGNRRVGAIGYSFGGYWTAKLALTGAVDAAVAVGAPVSATFKPRNVERLPNGMPGIIGNALGLDHEPDRATLAELLRPLSLREQGVLAPRPDRLGSPLLVANGRDDLYVPPEDVTVFEERPNTVVRLVENASHCVPERSAELVPWIVDWLKRQLA